MGLPNLPTAVEALFPFALLDSALFPIVLLMNWVRWAIGQVAGARGHGMHEEETVGRRVHVTKFKLLGRRNGDGTEGSGFGEECCCVCLHGFEGEEEVSEVAACKHFFHRACLDRWVDHLHSTCPLCRSTL